MLLETKDLKVNYGNVAAIKGVSLQVEEKSVVCLIGANGAGKTTLLRTISGLQEPTSGEIWFQGERIDGLPTHEIVRRVLFKFLKEEGSFLLCRCAITFFWALTH